MIIFGESGHTFPCHESTVPRSTQKQRWWKLSIHFCADEGTIETIFAQLILLISSVFTEQSQTCVTTANLALLEQGDLFWWDNLTHCLSEQVWWWKHLHLRPRILYKKIYCERLSQQNRVIKFLNWCRIPDNGWCRTVLHYTRHWRILTIYWISGLSWVHFAKRWKIIWKSQPVPCKVNMEW